MPLKLQLGTMQKTCPTHPLQIHLITHLRCSHMIPPLGNSRAFQGCLPQAGFKQLSEMHQPASLPEGGLAPWSWEEDGKCSFCGDYNNHEQNKHSPSFSRLRWAKAALKKRITAGGRQLSQGDLKSAFLSESCRKHIVSPCGIDSPCSFIF